MEVVWILNLTFVLMAINNVPQNSIFYY